MAQLQSPETYADGQQVTAARLNNQTNGATLLPGAITDQSSLAALTVASGDSVLLHDASTTSLRKTTVNDLLNSGIPITAATSTIDTLTVDQVVGKTNKDIDLNPNNGLTVTSKTFTSSDGITANVTAVAHGLKTGMHLNVTASNPAYTGKQVITVTSPDGFSFTIKQTTPVAASGTLSYNADATTKTTGNLFVAEQATVGTDLRVIGNSAVQGNSRVDGTLNVTGLANFTGGISVSGGNFLVMYAVTEEIIPFYQALSPANVFVLAYTGPVFDKPSNEFWYFEVDGNLAYNSPSGAGSVGVVLKFVDNATTNPYSIIVGQAGVASGNVDLHFHTSWIIPTGTALTSERIKIMFYQNIFTFGSGAGVGFGQIQTTGESNQTHALNPTKIRIFKYKPL
jgi:hypothetical protein